MNFLSVQLLLEILMLVVQIGGKATLLMQQVDKKIFSHHQQDIHKSLTNPHTL